VNGASGCVGGMLYTYTVRSIFQNLGCELDERDISMSAAFRAELKERLKGTAAPVPRVFIGTTYLGGFDEVQEMNEDERLRVILKVCDRLASPRNSTLAGCEWDF
jgi:glutaredoxin-related protein